NGLPTPSIPAATTASNWARSPLNPIQITQAFSNDPADRPFQDVGFDGHTDTAEQRIRQPYLNSLASRFGQNSIVYNNAQNDPASDNLKYYSDTSYDFSGTGLLGRYKY
ncbi:MAG: hypothetical protein ACK44U_07315, partial [Sphingobacteriales bacterium]